MIRRRHVDIPLTCVHCKDGKTRRRIVVTDRKTTGHYPICKTCDDTHVVSEKPGALLVLEPPPTDEQLLLPWTGDEAVA